MCKPATTFDPSRIRRPALPRALRAALGVAASAFAGTVAAATITVTTTLDEMTTDGKCSLREALANSNDNAQTAADCVAGSDPNTILFDPDVFPPDALTTSTLTMGPISIGNGNTTTIDGGGVVAIDGGGVQSLFVTAGYKTELKGLTLSHGHGGAIVNAGLLTLERCTVTGNSGTNGGAIANFGGLLVESSTLSGNTTTASGLGGAIYSANGFSATLRNSTISGNAAFKGGGMFEASMGGSIENTTIANNSAQAGVAIYFGAALWAASRRLAIRSSPALAAAAPVHSAVFKASPISAATSRTGPAADSPSRPGQNRSPIPCSLRCAGMADRRRRTGQHRAARRSMPPHAMPIRISAACRGRRAIAATAARSSPMISSRPISIRRTPASSAPIASPRRIRNA